MNYIVKYDPLDKKFSLVKDSKWIETLWTVIYAENLTSTAKIVFSVIMSHVFSEPLSFPSQTSLAKTVMVSVSTIRRSIAELKSFKLIEVPLEYSKSSGKSGKYIIHEYDDSLLMFSPQALNILNRILGISISPLGILNSISIESPETGGVVHDSI